MTAQQTLSGNVELLLPEFDAPPADPLTLLQRWIRDAERADVREPCAAALATVDAEGQPSTRIVLAKKCDGRGIVFTSQTMSRKGRDLAATEGAASMCGKTQVDPAVGVGLRRPPRVREEVDLSLERAKSREPEGPRDLTKKL